MPLPGRVRDHINGKCRRLFTQRDDGIAGLLQRGVQAKDARLIVSATSRVAAGFSQTCTLAPAVLNIVQASCRATQSLIPMAMRTDRSFIVPPMAVGEAQAGMLGGASQLVSDDRLVCVESKCGLGRPIDLCDASRKRRKTGTKIGARSVRRTEPVRPEQQ